MPAKNLQRFFRVFVLAVLAACSPTASVVSPTHGPTSALIGFQTSTPRELSLENTPQIDKPTATPATYTVVEGDTFFSIAATLGISLDALIAANPDADPRLLTPGTTLILPTGSEEVATPSIPTPTPVPINVTATNCYTTVAGELWCFVSVENTLVAMVENLAAVVQLFDQQGELVASLDATPPINLLVAGRSMPMVAYSPNQPHGWATAQGRLLSAFALTSESSYYLDATVQGPNVNVSEDGLTANIVGRVQIENGEAGTVWVLGVAYNADGEVVGVRRWESEGETEFAFFVYSLGGKIANVDLLVEVRP